MKVRHNLKEEDREHGLTISIDGQQRLGGVQPYPFVLSKQAVCQRVHREIFPAQFLILGL